MRLMKSCEVHNLQEALMSETESEECPRLVQTKSLHSYTHFQSSFIFIFTYLRLYFVTSPCVLNSWHFTSDTVAQSV
jgi:hypothetical protein